MYNSTAQPPRETVDEQLNLSLKFLQVVDEIMERGNRETTRFERENWRPLQTRRKAPKALKALFDATNIMLELIYLILYLYIS